MVLILDRTKIAILMAGATTVGTLLLMAGLLIGLGIRLPDHGSLPGDLARQPTQAVIVPSAVPRSSVPCNNAPLSTSVAQQQLGEPKTGLQAAQAATAFDVEVSQTAQPIATTQRALDHILGDEPAPEPIDHPGRVVVLPPPAPATTQAATFAVQVGAFLLEREAESMVEDLQGKGYTPRIAQFWAMRHSRKRLWYAVRIGGYADRGQAAHAAADFTSKEGKLAIVRPISTL
jgi:cell division septation protein DedD